jgi:aspartyl-tRNA(Asn)/glutamyl-tRNA(Gln) amidotransferase subunit C
MSVPTSAPNPAEERLLRAAALARVELEPHEVPRLARELERTLAAWASLRELDVAGSAPLWSLAGEQGPERADQIGASLSRDELLANAADVEAGCLRVPDALGGAR